MEGVLLVPPDRGTIIGRAMWKPRFVIVGPHRRAEQTASSSGPLYLAIYKSKNDSEPIQQHPMSSITECQVQVVAHRKQGQVAPTLVVSLAPDPATDKLRKRRSSRAAGLTSSSKESSANTLWFRTGDETLSLQDWERFIQLYMQKPPPASTATNSIMSPVMSPTSPTFTNPFGASSRSRDPSDYYPPPISSQQHGRIPMGHKGSTHSHSGRERPVTYSGSASLRSKRSDISSHASVVNNHSHQPSYAQHGAQYGYVHPSDLPSPATTVADYQDGQFIEGWTSAQGRSSTLSSPARGRDSISSQVTSPVATATPATPGAAAMLSSSPPGPRETILDRAFQMRCIPGSEMEVPGEEKLSSLARFEALMKEMDKKREMREAVENKARQHKHTPEPLKSTWEADEESDSDDDDDDRPNDSGYAARIKPRGHGYSQSRGTPTSPDFGHEVDLDEDEGLIPPGAQRALEFIATGRSSPAMSARSPATSSFRSPVEYSYGHGSLAPQPRPDLARTQSDSAAHRSQRLPQAPTSGTLTPTPSESAQLSVSLSQRDTAEKRLSGSSTKRLSFTEQLTRRLSSNSGLFLVQSNNSGGASGRISHDGDVSQTVQSPRVVTAHQRGNPTSPPPQTPADRERCGWRNSVVIGGEGGFM